MSGSPDLNPLVYALWTQLESIARSKPYKSVGGLKKAITKAVKNFPIDAICKSIEDWTGHICKCRVVQSGYFE